jgi:protein-S-isoprenylcysteine O-methyltransferase Ste14
METTQTELKKKIVQRGLQVLIILVIQYAMLRFSAGTNNWVWMWVFLLTYVCGILFVAQLFLRKIPETIAKRSESNEVKGWDKVIGGLWTLTHFFLLLIVAGLDFRFGWSRSFPLWLHWLGLAAFSLGFALFCWALYENASFSTVVRVQADAGQCVCSSGPYGYVRHPGYTGLILQSLGSALTLGSWGALIAAAAAIFLLVWRTSLEDATLQKELPGYNEFTRKTRFRLLPGIW